MPIYYSIKDFFVKAIKKPRFLFNYAKCTEQCLEKSCADVVWIRSPSVGSLLFAVIALRQGYSVMHHICANAMEAWKNEKYSFLAMIGV